MIVEKIPFSLCAGAEIGSLVDASSLLVGLGSSTGLASSAGLGASSALGSCSAARITCCDSLA